MRPTERQSNRKIGKHTCWYCKQKTAPQFLETQELERFTTDRGKIIPRSRTALCLSHQRKLATAIKRARFLALLPFETRV